MSTHETRRRSMRTLRQRLYDGEDGAALILVMLAILTAAALSTLVVGYVVSGVKPAAFDDKEVRTVHAAEAGIDAMLGQVRGAQSIASGDTTISGDRMKLPCASTAAPMTGTVGGEAGNLTYSVLISYYADNPSQKAVGGVNPVAYTSCPPPVVPNYALITATGKGTSAVGISGTAATRTLSTVYQFKLTNSNVSGGLIHNYNDGNAGTKDLCFDAGSGNPVAGTVLQVQACTPGSVAQSFAWNGDYTLALTNTVTQTSAGMCVTADFAGSSTSTNATLQPCDKLIHQQWGFNDGSQFQGQMKGSICLAIANDNTLGSNVIASQSSCGGGYNRLTTWTPDAKVGSGAAGTPDDRQSVSGSPFQWVNFQEFGRCFDITDWQTNHIRMIAFPCKQVAGSGNTPGDGNTRWNETLQWAGSGATPGQWFTYAGDGSANRDWNQNKPNGTFCVTAPALTGGYVTMAACTSGNNLQKWVINRNTGTYADSYTITDGQSRCLSVDGSDTSTHGDNDSSTWRWSSIVVQACNGSTGQKWNAPPNLTDSTTHDTQELPAS